MSTLYVHAHVFSKLLTCTNIAELWQYTDVLWLSIHWHDQPVALASMVCTFQFLYSIAPYWPILHKSRID